MSSIIRFRLLRRVCLQANLLSSSNVHHLVNSNHSSLDHQPAPDRKHLLCRIFSKSDLINVQQKRFKAKKKGSSEAAADEESDSDNDKKKDSDDDSSGSDEESDIEEEQIKKIETINTRIDMMIKYAFGGTKAKADQYINEGKVRVNGEKVEKKSDVLLPGDVVDIIHSFLKTDDNKLHISRLEFVEISDKKNSRGKYSSTVKLTKKMEIDNYEGDNSHKEV